MSRRSVQTALSAPSFAAAAGAFGMGLAGRTGSWLAAVVASLALLTAGFYFASSSSRRE